MAGGVAGQKNAARMGQRFRKKYEDWDSNPGFHLEPLCHKEIL